MENTFAIGKVKVLTGGQMLSEADRMARAEVEFERGIVRDVKGGIVMTSEQVGRRVANLKSKKVLTKARLKEAEEKNQTNKVEILKQRLVDIDAKIKELK